MNATTQPQPTPEPIAAVLRDALTALNSIPNAKVPALNCTTYALAARADAALAAEQANPAIRLTFVLPDSFCADVLCTALEGGIGYWSCADEIQRSDRDDKGDWHYLSAVLTDSEGDDDRSHTVDYAAIRRGIARALEPDFNLNRDTVAAIFRSVATLDAGDIDADAADAIVQAACFNELVYG